MKATLTFTLPEENAEFIAASEAQAILAALQDFDRELRNQAKYKDNDTMSIDDVRDLLRRCLDDYSVRSDV